MKKLLNQFKGTVKWKTMVHFFSKVPKRKLIYFNHGATSFPKPENVIKSVIETFPNTIGSNRGVLERFSMDGCRQVCSDFLGVDKNTIIFTAGCTMALNLAILGFPLKDGDHIVYSSVDHHATMRPSRIRQKESGGKITSHEIFCPDGYFDLNSFEDYMKANPVKLVSTVHCSNVLGTILPVEKIADICHEHGATYCLDTAQSAGHFPIPIDKVDMAAFAGHKGLKGPAGCGFLYKAPHVNLEPLMTGGTGGDSGKYDIDDYSKPESYEVGTQPVPLFGALAEGILHVQKMGPARIHKREFKLFEYFLKKLRKRPKVIIYGCKNANIDNHTSTITINVKGVNPKEVEQMLLDKYNIVVRAGFHCSSGSHKTVGTVKMGGAIRISLGFTNTKEEIDEFMRVFDEILQFSVTQKEVFEQYAPVVPT